MNNYQWYPGHMAKALKSMREDIKLVEVLIEITDARCPESTRNINITDLAQKKLHILLLNKSDYADPKVTKEWIRYYKDNNINAVALDSNSKSSVKKAESYILKCVDDNIEFDIPEKLKSIVNVEALKKQKSTRVMVAGIPNVGKSTFINVFAGKKSAKTGNKPGVTRGKQWIKIRPGFDMLDTPGVLYVKPKDVKSGMNLAFIGSLNDNNLDMQELALDLIKFMLDSYKGMIGSYYNIEEGEPLEVMEKIATCRGCIKKGGIIDYDRCAGIITDDFRSAVWGRVSLERPVE